jgi:tmRNA-binding protein
MNHEAKRTRKLAPPLSDRGARSDEGKGMTIIRSACTSTPAAMQARARDRARQELYDRRRDIAERDSRRDMERQLADVSRGR